MSDAFGDTASGGLEHDMPGLMEGQPGPTGPRQVPNVLGSLVGTFHQMFGGKPAPQAAGPGTSPFQAPGQSQIAPPMPGGPRQGGTTASLAMPKGSPQPPAKFTPFLKSQPTRDFTEWGQPEPYPNLPASFEVPSIYQGVAQFFQGQGGASQLSLPLILSMGKYAGDYMKGVMAGQEFRAKQAREQMQDAAFKAQQQMEAEHHVYADVFNQYASLNETMDPAKMLKPVNGVNLRDALHNQAVQIGDDKMAALIENGAKVSDIMEYQKLRDASLRDLQKANAKADEQSANDTMYGTVPGEKSAATGVGANATPAWAQPTAQPDTATPAPEGTDIGKAAPTQTPPANQVAGPGAPSTDGGDAIDPSMPWAKDNDAMREAEYSIARGQAPPTDMDPAHKVYAASQARRMQAELDKIRDDPNIKPDQVLDQVRKRVGGNVANELEGISNYDLPAGGGATGGGTGNKEQDWLRRLGQLAHKMKPGDPSQGIGGFSQQNYDNQRKFATNFPQIQNVIGRAATISTTGAQLVAALDKLQARDGAKFDQKWRDASLAAAPDQGGIMDRLRGTYGKAVGDPEYTAVFAAWQRYNMETNVLIRGGAGGQGETERTVDIVPPGSPAASYRQIIVQDAQTALGRLDHFKTIWKGPGYGASGPMPGTDPTAESGLKILSQINPADGTINVGGRRLRYVGADPSNPQDESNWEPAQ